MAVKMQMNGSVMVLLAAIGFGFNPLFAQILFAQGMSVEVVTLCRFILPDILLSFYLRTPSVLWPEVRRMIIIGFANALGVLGYFYALQTLTPATAILIYYTYPFFSLLIGILAFKRSLSVNALLSAVLVLIAASLVIDPSQLSIASKWALLGCFLAPIVFAFQIQYLAKPKQNLTALSRMAWGTMGHLVVLIPLAVCTSPEVAFPHEINGWWALLGLAFLAAALPQYLFVMGAVNTKPEVIAILGAVELVVAMLSCALFLGQALTRLDITAMLLVIVALGIRDPKPITMEHEVAKSVVI
ncbi:DMT family transporter [Psychromonas sp. PT13]|uniref:DMT family transporter n=1 Tax=Psychromonas sp. PT13 TaxID=3439547 RepID=UPI003EBED4B3